MSFKKILIAVDDSASAAHAADIGIELATSPLPFVALIHSDAEVRSVRQ
jgi:hypothetical protein